MPHAPRRSLLLAPLAAPVILRADAARAQGARRTIRLVVPFPPGGATDSLGRILAERLAPVLEQPVVVDNRGGAGGLIGADAVAKAPPDGTVIGMIGAATLCAAPFLQANMPFDPARDLRPVTQVSDAAVLLAAGGPRAAERGWSDLPAFLAAARANGGTIRVAHSGVATVSHLALSALATAAGVEFVQVPYRGGATATTDTIAGTLDATADLPAALVPHFETGRLRPLGVSSGRRLGLLPDVPAFAEFPGLDGIDVRSWNMIMVPAATPEAEVRRLHAAFRAVTAPTAFRDALRPLGYDGATSDSPGAAAALIAAETPRWRRLVELSGARVE